MTSSRKKYVPIRLPRKNPNSHLGWFDILKAANVYSVNHREKWLENGARKVSGWVVITPKGHILPSTFSMRRDTAKSRCLEPALQKFKGIIDSLFTDWEKVGYKLVRVNLVIVK